MDYTEEIERLCRVEHELLDLVKLQHQEISQINAIREEESMEKRALT